MKHKVRAGSNIIQTLNFVAVQYTSKMCMTSPYNVA